LNIVFFFTLIGDRHVSMHLLFFVSRILHLEVSRIFHFLQFLDRNGH